MRSEYCRDCARRRRWSSMARSRATAMRWIRQRALVAVLVVLLVGCWWGWPCVQQQLLRLLRQLWPRDQLEVD